MTRFIGITTHGMPAPSLLLEALHRFDFDTVLFPLNSVLYGQPAYRADAEELLPQCHSRDVGVITIKAIARGPWGDAPRKYRTWYDPFDEPAQTQSAVDFVLSQDVTALCTAGDPTLLPLLLNACARFRTDVPGSSRGSAGHGQPVRTNRKAVGAARGQHKPILDPPA